MRDELPDFADRLNTTFSVSCQRATPLDALAVCNPNVTSAADALLALSSETFYESCPPEAELFELRTDSLEFTVPAHTLEPGIYRFTITGANGKFGRDFPFSLREDSMSHTFLILNTTRAPATAGFAPNVTSA